MSLVHRNGDPIPQPRNRPEYLYPLPTSKPVHESYGVLLQALRARTGTRQFQMAQYLAPYLQEAGQPSLSEQMYAKLERDLRYPIYEELLPIACCLVKELHCRLSAVDAHDFVFLAQKKIESNPRKRSPVTPEQWDHLRAELNTLVNTQIQNHEEISHEALQALQYQEERQRLLIHLERDTSHIIGREEECTHLLAFLEQMSSPRKKVVAISAMSGVGKTSVLNLLQKRLLAQEKRSFQIITCESSKQTAQKPQDWFDQILATIYSTLEPKQKEASTVPSLEKRVRRTLQALCASPQPVVIFLDDAQYLIENSAWCVEWKQFLQAFLISDHQATLYIASRAWPAWQERETSSFLFHEDLPTISVEVGIQIWRNLGFAQEREELLRKATEMCGNNPRMMELVAQRIGLPDFSFDWNDESAPQEGLAHFVEHPHQAGIAPLLEEIIGNSLSEPAQQLLTLLALAPVPLPPPVALHVFPGAKHSVQDLVRASLLTKRPDRLRLLPMVAESAIEYTSQADRDAIHEQLTRAYRYWLQAGTFHSEQEQAQVVAELLLLYFQRHQLMEAAELLINAGWLCYHFGHGPRLARVCQEVLTSYDWKQSPQQELAANLLYDRLASFRGEKVTTADRARRYQVLHQNAQEAGIMLAHATMVYLLQPTITHLADIQHFEEAEALIASHLTQMTAQKERDPFIYASYLYCKAYLYAKWGEYGLPEQHINPLMASQEAPDQAYVRLEEAIRLFWDCIEMLRESERGASPLQRSRAIYKRARRLHNYAYYARLIGKDLERAKQALEACITIEKQGYTTLGSLATALGEYAQLLAAMGSYQEALEKSNQALDEMEKAAAAGYTNAEREKAVLLVERAEVKLLLGDLDEAKQLFTQAKPRLEHEVRREKYRRKAETGLKTITSTEGILRRAKGEPLAGQLDWRWYSSYSQIADFDISAWLDPTGPLSHEEQEHWRAYTEHGKVDELRQLMNSSLQRELDAAVAEHRSPQLFYPAIPIAIVREKIEEYQGLKSRIEQREPNKIVRRWYLEALESEIGLLRMVEALYQEDREALTHYNQYLFRVPTAYEMEVATGELLKIVEQGVQQEETKHLSQRLKKRLEELFLLTSRHNDIAGEMKEEDNVFASPLLHRIKEEQTTILADQAARFLEQCFLAYGFTGWKVSVKFNAAHASVNVNTKKLVLPERDFTPARVLHLLAHEVEGHVYRHANGARSKLSLLGYGLADYSPVEEALAVRYTAEVEQKTAALPWIGTFATGLASGITSHPGSTISPLGYHELYAIIRDYYLLSQLLQGKSMQTAQNNAHRFAQRRCQRTYLGGVCSPQDNSYLHGTLLLEDFFKDNDPDQTLKRLSVGCINIEHLSDCYQLGITEPSIPHRQLARQDVIQQAILDLVAQNK